MHTPHTLPESSEPDILQPEEGDMDENKEDEIEEEEEEEEEERSTGGDEESDMMEEREPQLETLGAPNLDGEAWSQLCIHLLSHFLAH